MNYRVLAAVAFSVFAGCGGSSDRGDVGASCVTGTNCKSGLYCIVRDGDVDGTCANAPSECGDTPCRDQTCTAALKDECATAGVACHNILGDVTIGCDVASTPGAAGDPCSIVAPCVEGTYCDINDLAEAGTCVELPAECGGTATCACLQSVADACSGGHECAIGVGIGYVACLN